MFGDLGLYVVVLFRMTSLLIKCYKGTDENEGSQNEVTSSQVYALF